MELLNSALIQTRKLGAADPSQPAHPARSERDSSCWSQHYPAAVGRRSARVVRSSDLGHPAAYFFPCRLPLLLLIVAAHALTRAAGLSTGLCLVSCPHPGAGLITIFLPR